MSKRRGVHESKPADRIGATENVDVAKMVRTAHLKKRKQADKKTVRKSVTASPIFIAGFLAVISTIGIYIAFQYIGSNPVETKTNSASRSHRKYNESDYKDAMLRKVKGGVQPGWFTANTSAYYRIDGRDDIHGLVQEMVTRDWPTVSNVLKHSVERLPVFHWDLSQFSHSSAVLPDCRVQFNDPVFVLGSEREKGGMYGGKRESGVEYVNVTVSDFLQATFQPNVYLYWTGELSYLEQALNLPSSKNLLLSADHVGKQNSETMTSADGTKVDDVSDTDKDDSKAKFTRTIWENFQVEDELLEVHSEDGDDLDESTVRPMLWLSHPGVVAQTHYDTQHNLFLQVQGIKKVHLFPPATELYLYPHIHRSYRQSQIHFERPFRPINQTDSDAQSEDSVEEMEERSWFPRVSASQVDAIEIVLHPGDLLYIPPYWQHRVESLTLSLSLSVLSPSRVEAALAEVLWQQVPFGRIEYTQSRSLRIRAVYAYVFDIFTLLGQEDDGSGETTDVSPPAVAAAVDAYVAELYETRFLPYVTKLRSQSLHTDDETVQLCPLPENSTETAFLADSETREKYIDTARTFTQLLRYVPTRTVAIPFTLFLRDYIEQLARWAVGPDLTGTMIENCFRQPLVGEPILDE